MKIGHLTRATNICYQYWYKWLGCQLKLGPQCAFNNSASRDFMPISLGKLLLHESLFGRECSSLCTQCFRTSISHILMGLKIIYIRNEIVLPQEFSTCSLPVLRPHHNNISSFSSSPHFPETGKKCLHDIPGSGNFNTHFSFSLGSSKFLIHIERLSTAILPQPRNQEL